MARPEKQKPVCDDCGGNGKRHVCGMGACVDFDDPCETCKGSGRREFYKTNVLVTPDAITSTIILTDLKVDGRTRRVKGAAMQDVLTRLGKDDILEKILTRTDVSLFGKVFRGSRIAKDIAGYLEHEMSVPERTFADTDESYFGKPPAPQSEF